MADASKAVSDSLSDPAALDMHSLTDSELSHLCQLSLGELGDCLSQRAVPLGGRSIRVLSSESGWLARLYRMVTGLFISQDSAPAVAELDLASRGEALKGERRQRYQSSLESWIAESPAAEVAVRARLRDALLGQMDAVDWPNNVDVISWRGEPISAIPKALLFLTNLTAVDLSFTQLKHFPELLFALPNLEGLSLRGSEVVAVPIPAFERPKLEALDLSGTLLSEFPEQAMVQLSGLRYLNISKTPLYRIPEGIRALEQLEVLDLSGCRASLQQMQIAELPRLVIRRSTDVYADALFEVERSALNENPVAALKQLAEFLATLTPEESFKVIFAGEHADDAGGPTRELWSLLGKQLFSESPSSEGRLYASGDAATTGVMPCVRLDQMHYDGDLQAAEMLGQVVAVGLRLSPPALLPAVMSKGFYAAVLAHIKQEPSFSVVQQALQPSPLDDILLFQRTGKLSEGMLAIAAELYDWESLQLTTHAAQEGYLLHHLEAFKDHLVEYNQGFYAFIGAFTAGLRKNTDFVQQAQQMSLEQFITACIGCLDREALSEQIVGGDATEELVDWCKEWIMQAPTEKLQKLLFLISGSEVPLQGRQIRILKIQQEEGLRFSTCSQELKVPNVVTTKQQFLDLLEEAVAFDNWGYSEP